MITNEKIEIITSPHTDLWKQTYYHFRNDNAPVLQIETDKKFFSFIVKTEFESKHRFDQCGISRREADYCIECSQDGVNFTQMRICHMWKADKKIYFGIYACSPENSSFKATFTNMEITECMWKAHDGQKPDDVI